LRQLFRRIDKVSGPRWDKRTLLDSLKAAIEAEIAEARKAYEHARETSVVSDGRMQSRYDTMGVEAAWKADSLNRTIQEKSKELLLLERVPLVSKPLRAAVGTIVGVGPEAGEIEAAYFILPAAGGHTLGVNSSLAVTTVAFQAPLAQALVGLSAGDRAPLPGSGRDDRVVLCVE
jgi:transcription elongation GreA/GreB family factor